MCKRRKDAPCRNWWIRKQETEQCNMILHVNHKSATNSPFCRRRQNSKGFLWNALQNFWPKNQHQARKRINGCLSMNINVSKILRQFNPSIIVRKTIVTTGGGKNPMSRFYPGSCRATSSATRQVAQTWQSRSCFQIFGQISKRSASGWKDR